MTIYEKRKKLYKEIKEELIDCLGIEEVKRYYKEFKFTHPLDYNIVQYGNLLVYYSQIREFYSRLGFDYTKYNDDKIWEKYKKDVGIVVRKIMRGEI